MSTTPPQLEQTGPDLSAPGAKSALGGIVVGRTVLFAIPLALIVCRATIDIWADTRSAGALPTHWIPQATFVLLFAFAVSWPLLLLPATSGLLLYRREGMLRGITVPGNRKVDAVSARVLRLTIPGSVSANVISLLDARFRLLIVVSNGSHRARLAGHSFPIDSSHSAKVSRVLLGLSMLAVVVVIGLGALFLLGLASGVITLG